MVAVFSTAIVAVLAMARTAASLEVAPYSAGAMHATGNIVDNISSAKQSAVLCARLD